MSSQHREKIVNSIEATSKMSLCMQLYCSKGCIEVFHKIVKEVLANQNLSRDEVYLLTPGQRRALYICLIDEVDFLSGDENILPLKLCQELDPLIPQEYKIFSKKKVEQQSASFLQAERRKLVVTEYVAVKIEERVERHNISLKRKRERDIYYWIAYWAARHSMQDLQCEKRSVAVFSKFRRSLQLPVIQPVRLWLTRFFIKQDCFIIGMLTPSQNSLLPAQTSGALR
jgi:hypothetical protein